MLQDNKNQPNSQQEPCPNDADTSPKKSKSNGNEKGLGAKKRWDWRDWVLVFVAGAAIVNGVSQIPQNEKLDTVIKQHSTISQRDDRLAKRDLLTSTEAQVREIKEFMTRNRDEIRTVDHYNYQLTLHAQTAIDFANEAVSKTPEDALTKAIKKKIEILESVLGSESEGRKKRTFEEVYDIAKNTQDLLELSKTLTSLWATQIRPFADGDETQCSVDACQASHFCFDWMELASHD